MELDGLFEIALAEGCFATKNYGEAEEHLRKAMEMGFERAPELILRCRLAHGKRQRILDAIDELTGALGPGVCAAYAGAAEAIDGMPVTNLEAAMQGASHHPDRHYRDFLLAILLRSGGKRAAAIEALNSYVSTRSLRDSWNEHSAATILRELSPAQECSICGEVRGGSLRSNPSGPRFVCDKCTAILEDPATLEKCQQGNNDDPDVVLFTQFYGRIVSELVAKVNDTRETLDRGSQVEVVFPERSPEELLSLLDEATSKALAVPIERRGTRTSRKFQVIGTPEIFHRLVTDRNCRESVGEALKGTDLQSWAEHAKSLIGREQASPKQGFSSAAAWALNVAGWITLIAGKERIRPGTLVVAILLTETSPCFSVEWAGDLLTNVALQKPSIAQRDYFVGLVESHPDSLYLRAVLASWGFAGRADDAWNGREHAFWFIENWPALEFTGNPWCEVDDVLDPENHLRALKLWQSNTRTYRDQLPVLRNAARHATLSNPELCEALYKRAQVLDPNNREWADDLAHLYELDGRHQETEVSTEQLAKAFEQREKAVQLSASPQDRMYELAKAARTAFDVGDYQRAERYAMEAVVAAEADMENAGSEFHHGYLILGRLALRRGDRAGAAQHLLRAGQTPGSAPLCSFGPNMLLAKELLELGEREVVLEYFDRCRKFWDRQILAMWAETVRTGGIPDFGANLVY